MENPEYLTKRPRKPPSIFVLFELLRTHSDRYTSTIFVSLRQLFNLLKLFLCPSEILTLMLVYLIIFSSTGHRPASLCHGTLSVVRPYVRPCVCPSVGALTFSLNIFSSDTAYRILMKFCRNVPAMVLLRIS